MKRRGLLALHARSEDRLPRLAGDTVHCGEVLACMRDRGVVAAAGDELSGDDEEAALPHARLGRHRRKCQEMAALHE